MSIPAVLYDHVPVDDLKEDGDFPSGSEGISFYVSSMVHRSSAPLEGDEDYVHVYATSNRFEQIQCTDNKNGSDNSIGATDSSKESDVTFDDDNVEDIEIDVRRMETIIEDIDLDYVLIPIPPPIILPNSDDTDSSSSTHPTTASSTRTLFKSLLKTMKNSSVTNHGQITKLCKVENTYAAKCLSQCASVSRAILRPFQIYVRDKFFSSSIYSSYDWVSETVIDASGNRLILPGSCVSWGSDDAQESNENQEAGALIVPEGCDALGLKHETKSSTDTKASSMWSSNTIMVSAHDLLAVKHDQSVKMDCRDDPQPLSLFETIEEEEKGKPRYGRYYYRDDTHFINCSAIAEATTHNVAQQWARALWKLTERKAKIWYCISRSYLRRSIRNTGRQIIIYHQYLIQYYKARKRKEKWPLPVPSTRGVVHSEDQSQNIEYEKNWEAVRDMVSRESSQILSDKSFRNQMTSNEIIDGCDFGMRISECTCLIEMATPLSKRRTGL